MAARTLADADAVIAVLDLGPPTIVGHSLGGHLGLRYAATRSCSGWIGLDGPFGLVYPWDLDDPGLPETILQIGREIRAIDVISDFAATNCPVMLLLCAIAASPIEERIVPVRRELAHRATPPRDQYRMGSNRTRHDPVPPTPGNRGQYP
jgi:pimeloyl-ACP methyl ester carboxylesterase